VNRLSQRFGLTPVVIQLASAVIAGGIVIAIAVVGSSVVERTSKSAASDANASLLASQISADADSVVGLKLGGAQAAAGAQPLSETSGSASSLTQAIAAHDALMRADEKGQELHRLVGSDVTLQISGATGEATSALDAYLADPSQQNFDDLQLRLDALRSLASFEVPRLTESAQAHQATLLSGAASARVAIVVATVLASAGSAITTLVIGQRLRRAMQRADDEKQRLVETSRAMQRRNDQFGALYQVVSEVSESLSMRYVVRTTIREARALVQAEIVSLRRIEQNQLILAGVEHDDTADVSMLSTVPLGTGIAGRVAKRGKTIRIDDGADMQMGDADRIPGVASGIVVPLIVGARVVGTLACWSRSPNHFDADDERILEMMASQVATAIAAADVHEATDREAHLDPLTSLPNRRQLHEDLGTCLLEEIATGEPMTLAMVDIDNFKRFNDDFGHRVGDITLQKVSDVLRSTIRQGDHVYRFGGEEFLVVFEGARSPLATELSERLRIAVERTVLTGENLEPVGPLTISVGLASYPDDGVRLEELIDLADRAMYASKEGGRNRVTVYRQAQQPEQLAA